MSRPTFVKDENGHVIKTIRNVRCGEWVYCLFDENNIWIEKAKVFMKNDEAFIIPSALDPDLVDETKSVFYFDCYKKTWFKTLAEVKEYMQQTINEPCKLKKTYESYDGSSLIYDVVAISDLTRIRAGGRR